MIIWAKYLVTLPIYSPKVDGQLLVGNTSVQLNKAQSTTHLNIGSVKKVLVAWFLFPTGIKNINGPNDLCHMELYICVDKMMSKALGMKAAHVWIITCSTRETGYRPANEN